MFRRYFQRPEILLYFFSAAVPLSFATWQALINNFSIEQVGFTGIEIGILQSLREIPGFIAFGVIFLLLIMREQTVAFMALLALGIGTAITGYLPSIMGLYFSTVLMSLGFHYAETIQQSLTLQLIDRERLPVVMGKQIAVGSFTGLFVFAALYCLVDLLDLGYELIYLLGGSFTVATAVVMYLKFPHHECEIAQAEASNGHSPVNYWMHANMLTLNGQKMAKSTGNYILPNDFFTGNSKTNIKSLSSK